jgi:hypothetical protein
MPPTFPAASIHTFIFIKSLTMAFPMQKYQHSFQFRILSVLQALLIVIALEGEQGFSQTQSAIDLLSKAIEQRQRIASLDLEIDIKGLQSKPYDFIARCTHAGEMRRIEMWLSGLRRVETFNGKKHLLYENDNEEKNAAMLTDGSAILGERGYEIVDARKVGMLPLGFLGVSSMNLEEVYFSKEAKKGSVTELDNGIHLVSWIGSDGGSNWKIWVDSTKDYCVIRCEFDWKIGVDRYNDKVDLVVEKHDDEYFPTRVEYKRILNNQENLRETCLIKVLAINKQFDEEFFSIENAGLPKYVGVFRVPEAVEMCYWDGTSLLSLAELKEREIFWERMRWAIAISLGLVVFGIGLVWLRRRKK